MSLTVMKFGGTSVGTREAIARSALLAASEARRNQVVVVISALNGVTNQLYNLVQQAKLLDWQEVEDGIKWLDNRHREMIMNLGLSSNETGRLLFQLETLLSQISSTIDQVHQSIRVNRFKAQFVPDIPFLELQDTIVAIGERLAAFIFSALLRQAGVAAQYMPSDELIFTDDAHSRANVIFNITNAAILNIISPLLSRGIVPVVTGFFGSSLNGSVTTLGRGASDYTSSIIGAALSADEIWNWTDVDGVLSADPKIAPRARLIQELSYDEMAILSNYGARVLHPETVRPISTLGIPLRVRNSFHPEHPGTLVRRDPPERDQRPLAVTCLGSYQVIDHKPIALITVVGGNQIENKIMQVFDDLPVDILTGSVGKNDGCYQAAVWEADAPKAVQFLHDGLVVG